MQGNCPFNREGFLAIIFDNGKPGFKYLTVDLLHVLMERALVFDFFQDVTTLLGATNHLLRLFILLFQCRHVVDFCVAVLLILINWRSGVGHLDPIWVQLLIQIRHIYHALLIIVGRSV